MSIIVEHEKRRKEILERALDVFVEEGFEDTTFQKIADRCGITRTTLYLYFKNKREIFNFSIKQLLSSVEEDLKRVRQDGSLPAADKLKQVLGLIMDRLQENRRLLSVVLNYLLYLSKSGTDTDYRVRRRTIRLRHILATIVIEGIRRGELKPVNVKTADDMLYGLIEAAIFRLVVLRRTSIDEIRHSINLAIENLRA
ncbi:MAG: TetR/AcrR family transcriptional regulator [Treponemataceae bacterium]|uniref:TetR/AcrR family transcriptional regulator n=1 Tax=Treponema sp. J25 TaxID=2094121 RepID=UPI00104E5F6E|nr:TetR/AcrR family transcriptional regulator [Treponema sp. J25]MCX7948541.1 TetR/AcrR family transcriptional regulator [Treponemataceae bacterium]TCW62179.1 TetR/AcrR family transcriptional regulator [Treponema sp. J25]